MQVDLTAFQMVSSDPMFLLAAAAAVIGITLHYLYGGFIEENHRKIIWFRRLLLPHFTFFLRQTDSSIEDVDLSRLYVETVVTDEEYVFAIDDSWSLDEISDVFLEKKFRPEALLASLASDMEGRKEVGNWVLTAPRKDRNVSVRGSRLYEVVQLLTAKWQLHVRLFHDEEKGVYSVYAHYEYNPYCPLYAMKHFEAEGMNKKLGVEMAHEMLSEEFELEAEA